MSLFSFIPNQKIKSSEVNANFQGLADGSEILDEAIVARHHTVEDWHIVGSVGEPAYENSWVSHTVGSYPIAGFYKDSLGVVHLQGLVKNGSPLASNIFTLPVGYRPLYSLHISVASNSAYGQIRIYVTGDVRVQQGSTNWLSLDGITFRADGS